MEGTLEWRDGYHQPIRTAVGYVVTLCLRGLPEMVDKHNGTPQPMKPCAESPTRNRERDHPSGKTSHFHRTRARRSHIPHSCCWRTSSDGGHEGAGRHAGD